MYYLCIGQRRKPRAAAGFLLFFGPFRGSQRAFSRQTADYVGKTKCLVVLRKSFVIFPKCFPRKTTKPRDCYRRLKTLKVRPGIPVENCPQIPVPSFATIPHRSSDGPRGHNPLCGRDSIFPTKVRRDALDGEKPVYRELREEAPLPLTKIPHGKTYAVSSAGRMGIAPFFVHTKAEV